VNSTVIKLYDEDGGLFDGDDFLGSETINAADAGLGRRTAWFIHDNDAIYSLVYEVI
jgi:hypothetical protein